MDLVSFTRFLNGFLMIALPIMLGIYLVSKFQLGWKFCWAGAAIFIISQIFHLLFNAYVLNPGLGKIQQANPDVSGAIVIAILLGLSAGIFESSARFVMYRWWLKDARSWRKGILAGAGHGGMEAILLGVLVMTVYLNMMTYHNLDLSNLNLSPDQLNIARQQIQTYWSLPWYDTLLGALERIFTIPFHIAASLLVLQVFTRKPGVLKPGWLFLAILYHSLMDASAVFIAGQWGNYAAEAVLGGLTGLHIIIIFALRQPEPESITPLTFPTSNVLPVFTPLPVEESSENLENTRYQ